MSTYSFFAGDCCGEIRPSGQSIEDFFGCQDVAAALYFTTLFNGPGRTCWVHDDAIDGDCHPAIDEDDLTTDDQARLTAMRAIEWHEADGYAVASFDAPVGRATIEVKVRSLGIPAVSGFVNGSYRLTCLDFQECKARIAAYAYPMGVPA